MTTLVQYKLLLILIKHGILFENEHLQKASTKKICMNLHECEERPRHGIDIPLRFSCNF